MVSIEDWEEKLDKKPVKNCNNHIPKDVLNPLIQLCKFGIVTKFIQKIAHRDEKIPYWLTPDMVAMHIIVTKFIQKIAHRDEKTPYWLTPDMVAMHIGANHAYVAIVFGKLEKEEFLFPLESYPISQTAYINGMTLIFKNGKWKEERKGHFSSRIESTTWKSRVMIKKQWISKTDYLDSNWDGKARRLNINSKSFIDTCMELNYHPKMMQSWKCSCNCNNISLDEKCHKCELPRVIPELEKYKLSKSKKQNTCKLCGIPMRTHNRNQTEHTKEACIKRICEIVHSM